MSGKTKSSLDIKNSVLSSLGAKPAGFPTPSMMTGKEFLIDLYQWFDYGEPRKPPIDGAKAVEKVSRRTDFFHCDQLESIAANQAGRDSQFWGVVTARLQEQLGFGCKELTHLIQLNPNYDLFFFNPHPSIEALFTNLWQQGATCHPGFLDHCSLFFDATSLGEQVLKNVVPSRLIATGNCFVGNSRFWDSYLTFMRKIYSEAMEKLKESDLSILRDSSADSRGLHYGSNYFRFIEERLLTEFLSVNPGRLKVMKVQSPLNESKLNSHEKSLRMLRDLSIQSKDKSLLSIWAGYRDLYLGLNSTPLKNPLSVKPKHIEKGSRTVKTTQSPKMRKK